MKRLEMILSELMRIEYDIKAFSVVIRALEKRYELEDAEELKAILCLFRGQTEACSAQLANSITELDRFLLDNR